MTNSDPSPGHKKLIVNSTTPSPEETYLCDLYIGQIGVMAENDSPMPAGHYLRTYEEYVYLEDPMNTYMARSFDGHRDSFYAINILNPGSVVTLKVT